jgi:hypothetical protein
MRQVQDKWDRAGAGRALAAAVGVVVVLVAAACSPSKGTATGTTTTTTNPSAPTTAAGSTTTYPVPPTTPISIPRSTDGTSPDGSGCDPPSGTELSDGIWFGVLKSVDPSTNTVGLDLACWFTGQAAQAASGSSGPVPDDHFIRNENPKVYELPAAPQTAVLSLAQSGNGGFNQTTTGLASANAILSDQSEHYVWVQITRGFVVVIQAQFTP